MDRSSFSLPVATSLCAILALTCVFALRQAASLDAGFHLSAGASILAGDGWPARDRLTYTLTDRPYVDTSWGYQVMVAAVEGSFGAGGLVALHALAAVATFALAAGSVPRDASGIALLPAWLLLAVLSAELRFQVRPELVSYLFLALTLFVLTRHAEGRSGALWVLPPLFWVWGNTHALFVTGWAALGCFLVGDAWRRRALDGFSVKIAAACVLAPLANPYGLRGVVFPFTLLTRFDRDNPFSSSIGEFVSPLTLGSDPAAGFPFYPVTVVWAFRILFVLVLLSLPGLWRRRRFDLLLVTIPFAYLAAKMVRNVPLLAVVALPTLVIGLEPWLARLPGRRHIFRLVPAGAALVALLWIPFVVTDAHYLATRRSDRFGVGWNRTVLPVEAAAWARDAGLPGRVLNHLNFGGWWRWATGSPVFIDGRLEVVGEDFYDRYRAILADPRRLEAAVREWDVGYVVFPYATNRNLLQGLSGDRRWRLLYVDGVAAIFGRADRIPAARVDPGTRARTTGRVEVDLTGVPGLDPAVPRRRAFHPFRKRHFPDEGHALGLFHYFRRDPARAAVSFARATRESGGSYYELYHNLGAALRRLGRTEEALACYRIVLAENPEDRAARERVAELAQGGGGR